MPKTKTKPFNAAKYLKSKKSQMAYLKEARKTGDSVEIARALKTVAKARA